MIEVGDHVIVGDGKVHWVVESINKFGQAGLRSPMSGRTSRYYLGSLILHSKGAA